MKLFRFGKQKPQEPILSLESRRCVHPVRHQVMLHEDSTDPLRITGIKCGQCGEVLEWLTEREAA